MPGDLSITLNNALSGLRINQQQLSVLSQNIANANTAGYSRQTLTQQAVALDGVGQGVNALDIARRVDEYLQKSVRSQTSNASEASAMSDYYSRIQLRMGNPGQNNSIDAYINDFMNSIQALAQSPDSATLKQTAVNSANGLASYTSELAKNLRDLQYQADQDISVAIRSVNADLVNIGKLNTTIATSISLGKNVSELQDQRDVMLSDIAQYVDIKTFTRTDGTVSVTTGGGIPILDNDVYQFSYSPAGSPNAFSDNISISSIYVTRVDDALNPTAPPVAISSAGTPGTLTTVLQSGKMSAFLQMRDQQIPNILNQLDSLTYKVTDQFNALHNSGSSYPGANSLTGTRVLYPLDRTQWNGSIQLALIGPNGEAAASPYADETYGLKPLKLDLGALDTGFGAGNLSTQDIANAINSYYSTPQNKAKLGNVNNIELVSNSASLPAFPTNFNFSLNLDNIDAAGSNVYVTNVKVETNNGTDITAVTSTIPTISLAATGTYQTVSADTHVTVTTAAGTGTMKDGDVIYIPAPPAGVYNGLSATDLGGYFRVSNVTATTFDIELAGATPSASGPLDIAGINVQQPYDSVAAGGNKLTASKGIFTQDMSSGPATTATSYLVSMDVGVDDGTGTIVTSTITYRVNNNLVYAQGTQFAAIAANGAGTVVTPISVTQPPIKAIMVDDKGRELPIQNGQYMTTRQGYLKIVATNSSNSIAIDSLDSKDIGYPNAAPANPGTGRGFSYYYELNNFFKTNTLGVKNSALNLKVEERITQTPGLITLGQLSRNTQDLTVTAKPNYTYSLNVSDNSIIQKLAELSAATSDYAPSGGLGASVQTYSGYAGQIIGSASSNAAGAQSNAKNTTALLDGLSQQASAVSGVNLDVELANTVIYQNAYSASARVITLAGQLFDTLLQAVQI